MRKWLTRLAYVALWLAPVVAWADYTATQGAGSTVFAFVCSSTKICPATVLIDSTNVEKATAGNPLRIDPVGTTAQPATQSGTWTVQPGNTANTTPWLASINQGSNTAVVKAASTAAAAADPSLVVNESPNSQLSVATGSVGQAALCAAVSNTSMLQCLEQIHADLTAPLVPSSAASNWLGNTGNLIVNPSNNFTVAQNAHTYASGQLIANSTTAGSVVPLSWTAARVVGGNYTIRRVRFTSNAKPTSNRNFRIHFILPTTGGAAPTVTNGDGGTFTVTEANEVCAMDITDATFTVGSDVSVGYGVPISGTGNDCNLVAQGGITTLYGFVEARGAYVSGTSDVFTVIPEIFQN